MIGARAAKTVPVSGIPLSQCLFQAQTHSDHGARSTPCGQCLLAAEKDPAHRGQPERRTSPTSMRTSSPLESDWGRATALG